MEISRELSQITAREYQDLYRQYHPEDSKLWLELFLQAGKIDENLASILMYIRNTGAVLLSSNEYGYVIRPIIGTNGWSSQEEYDKEKQCRYNVLI